MIGETRSKSLFNFLPIRVSVLYQTADGTTAKNRGASISINVFLDFANLSFSFAVFNERFHNISCE